MILSEKPVPTFPDHALRQLTLKQSRHLSGEAGSFANKEPLQRRRTLDNAEA